MIKLTTTLTQQEFIKNMREAEDCEGKFTDEGLKTLFEHLHKQGDTEFDAVQICNGWKEYHDINIANSLCTGDYEVEAYTLVLHCANGRVIVKDF
jgi:hypothetical protein